MLADNLGYAESDCYGQNWIETPNIDRLAAEGIRFTQHYSENAVCALSRCYLMTGKHPGHADIRSNGDTEVTDEGMKHLSGLMNLHTSWLGGTHVSGDGVKMLQQALPKCHISYFGLLEP